MRLLLDPTALQDNRGMGRFAKGVAPLLRRSCEVVECEPSVYLRPGDAALGSIAEDVVRARGIRAVAQSCDACFFPSVHFAPVELPPRSVVGVLDAIPLLLPEYFTEGIKDVWRKRLAPIARQADAVVTISEPSADDIARVVGIPRERVHVVPLGVDVLPDNPQGPRPEGDYFVWVGSSDAHKGLETIFRALDQIADLPVRLAVVGARAPRDLARQWRVEHAVDFMGRLDDADLGHLLRGTRALLWPSLYEGLGLPPLEALALGVPVISSNRPAMGAVLRDYAILLPPPHLPQPDARPYEFWRGRFRSPAVGEGAWVAQMWEACHVDWWPGREMAKAGREMVLRQYTWPRCHAALLQVLERVAGARPRRRLAPR